MKAVWPNLNLNFKLLLQKKRGYLGFFTNAPLREGPLRFRSRLAIFSLYEVATLIEAKANET